MQIKPRCLKCLSTDLYKRTKRQLLSRHAWAKIIKTEYKEKTKIKLDIPNYKCVLCGFEFDDPALFKGKLCKYIAYSVHPKHHPISNRGVKL